MKKLTRAAALITVILSFWMLAAGCAAIPAPKKAEEKLRNAGYKVSVYDSDDPVSTYMESDERIEIHLYSMIFANDSSFDKAKGDFIFIFYFETKDKAREFLDYLKADMSEPESKVEEFASLIRLQDRSPYLYSEARIIGSTVYFGTTAAIRVIGIND